LSQQTKQLAAIISDSVQKLPNAAELPRHDALDMVVAIREGVTEQLKREWSGRNFDGTAHRH
jgi:hypothetical protein